MTSLFVSGRLCLFGEHSDWAAQIPRPNGVAVPGACLVVGTDQGIRAVAAPARTFQMLSRLPDGSIRGPFESAMEGAALEMAARDGGFFSYAAGVAAVVRRRFSPGGVAIRVDSIDLPVQRGLSSSAAVCVLVARSFNTVYGLGLSVEQEMDLAYEGERLAGSQCGRMDQACAFGRTPVLLRFRGEAMEVETLAVARGVQLLIVDLCSNKDTRRILADLHAGFRAGDSRLQEALGQANLDLVASARLAVEAGDAARLGVLMADAQELFDRCVAPICPELAAPKLHTVLQHPATRELAWGGKGVGSQGDGTAQLVCRDAAARIELARILMRDCGVRCLPLTLGRAGGLGGLGG